MNKLNCLKYLAFYLPQFHVIPENDKWWGKGFTEWTNVKSAKPRFNGHYQPHEPHDDVSYYDLSDVEVMEKQAKMAKEYGIYGFCYYYYWFNGRTLLEKPLLQMLAEPKVDMPFCFMWANHNWTRSWDVGEDEILIEQTYDSTSYERFIDDLVPYLDDKRYITVNGKAVLLIYQLEKVPNNKNVADELRRHAKEKYGKELYLILLQQNNLLNPEEYGFDAALEGAPNFRAIASRIPKRKRPKVYKGSEIIFYDYLTNIFQYIIRKEPYKLFKCAYPLWDNSSRRIKKASWMFLGGTPEIFQKFLEELSKYSIKNFGKEERFVFINAWNEWAEGAHLEPDKKYGYAFLRACKSVIEKSEKALLDSGFDEKLSKKMQAKLHKKQSPKVYLFGIIRMPFLRKRTLLLEK